MRTKLRRVIAALSLLAIAAVVAAAAEATVNVTRAEISGSRLRIEGTSIANRTITVDGVAMGTSDAGGNFRIERDPFTSPADCNVDVDDGSASPRNVTLSGCSVNPSPPPPPPPPPPSPPPAPPPPPPPSTSTLSSVAINPSDVVGGDPATGTVTLTAAAPAGGVRVDLANDNPTAVTVPPSVIVPAGSTSATFPVSTNSVSNSQSATIVGTIGGDWATHKYAIITVWTPFHYANGSISILPGGGGSGRVTSQPAGIDCTITRGNGAGSCSAFYPVGTTVRLEARPAADSQLLGWSTNLPGCSDPSRVRIARGTNITCRPILSLK